MNLRKTISAAGRTIGVLAALAFVGGTALAHGEHGGHSASSPDLRTPALFIVGVGILVASACLDRLFDIERQFVDAGFSLGLLVVVLVVAVSQL